MARTHLVLSALLGLVLLRTGDARLGAQAAANGGEDDDGSDAELAKLAARDTSGQGPQASAGPAPQTALQSSVLAGLQGTMMLAQLMPHESDGSQASPEVADIMSRAGDLAFDAHTLLHSTENEIEVASEHVGTGMKVQEGLKTLPPSEAMISVAAKKLQQAKDLNTKGRALFSSGASPLGDPPIAPKAWGHITSMLQQATTELMACRERVSDVRSMAKREGMSLMSVGEEKAVVIQDVYGNAQDSKLEYFLNNY